VLSSLTVDIGLSVMGLLVDLVADGIEAGLGAGGDGGVGVFGDVLVGFFGGGAAGALDGLGDVVGCVLDGIHCDGGYFCEYWY